MKFPLSLACVAALGLVSLVPVAAHAEEGAPVVLDAMSRDVPLSVVAHTNGKSQWVPKLHIGVAFADVEADDILLIQHYKGHGKRAKKWGAVQKCTDQWQDTKSERRYGQKITFFNCTGGDDLLNKKPGKYSFRITYRQTGAGIDHADLKTVEYTVGSYHSDASGGRKSKAFYVDHDLRLGEGWLTRFGDGKTKGQEVRFSTWLKWASNGEPRNVAMRCYLGSKKIGDFNSHNRYDIKVVDYPKKGADGVFTSWGKYVFHVKPNFGKGMVHWAKPSEGEPNAEVFYLLDNPGDYRCAVTFEGEVVRELTFTIADGAIAQPDCVGTSVRPAAQHHLIDVAIKPGLDPKYDKKAFAKSGWFGVGASACK